MTTDYDGLTQLAGLQALSTLNEVLSEMSKRIAILEDERDEYRRKWLNEIEAKQSAIGKITNS